MVPTQSRIGIIRDRPPVVREREVSMKRALAASAIAILTLLGSLAAACAAERPIQVSIFTPAQLVPEEDGVRGLRLNLIYGRNKSVQGIDVGFVNRLTSGQSSGLQIGLVGMVDVDFCGAQLNVFNFTDGNFKGFQWGFVNYARCARGLQVGLVNFAYSMRGVQIGFLNGIQEAAFHPVLPVVNFSF